MTPESSLASSPLRTLGERAETITALDAPGKKIAKAVRGSLKPGPTRDLLSGTWMGHALHPLLTDLVIGSWSSATILDLVGGKDSHKAAERLIAVGIAAYGPTAATGVTDWADGEPADPAVRRVGLIHAAANSVALALYTASLARRRRGDRATGVALGLAGLGALGAGGFLGAHLIYRQGQGVDQTTFDDSLPTDWTDAAAADELEPGKALGVQVGDVPVLLVRHSDRISALHDRCSHRGCSLSDGDIANGTVTCGCHGSRFRLADGELLRGPATSPQPAFQAREQGGRIEVRRDPAG